MSQPSYGVPAAPKARRRRPSRWWLAAGLLMLVVGVGLSLAALVLTIKGFTAVEATVPADGTTETLRLDADTSYLIWVHPDEPDACTVVEVDGRQIGTSGLGATSYTRDIGSEAWEGDRTFESGSGDIEVTCAADGGPIQIGPEPAVRTVVGGLVLGLLLPILVGAVGFVVLIVAGILYAIGGPNQHPGAPTR